MIKISHRGNLYGPEIDKENNPEYVLNSIKNGFETEVDFWIVNNNLFFGHDYNQYRVDLEFLQNNISNLWLHCKNLDALNFVLSSEEKYKSFWHQSDDYTLTTNGLIWTYPGKNITKKSILVHKELPSEEVLGYDMYAICSDYVGLINE